jgi:hypothetical protein
MRLHTISPQCYECRPSELCPYGVEALLMSFFSPVAAKLRSGRVIVSDRARAQRSHDTHIQAALERWGRKEFDEVSFKELDALADDLRV